MSSSSSRGTSPSTSFSLSVSFFFSGSSQEREMKISWSHPRSHLCFSLLHRYRYLLRVSSVRLRLRLHLHRHRLVSLRTTEIDEQRRSSSVCWEERTVLRSIWTLAIFFFLLITFGWITAERFLMREACRSSRGRSVHSKSKRWQLLVLVDLL